MVQVPQSAGPSVAPSARPVVQNNVQAPIEAFGGGQAASRVNDAYQKIIEEENNRAFNDRMMEASRSLDDFELKTIYDPQTGLLQRKGKDALGVIDEYGKSFEEFSRSQLKNTSDPVARQALAQMFSARNSQVQKTLANHTASQMDAYHNTELSSGIRSSYSIAAADPSRVPSRIDLIRGNTVELAKQEGFPPGSATSDLLVAQNIESLHDHVLSAMMERKQYNAARVYLGQYGAQMPNSAGKFAKQLETAGTLGKAQAIGDSVFKDQVTLEPSADSAPSIIGPNVVVKKAAQSLEEALSRAREASGGDADLRKQAEAEVEHRWAIKEANAIDEKNALIDSTSKYVDANPGKRPEELFGAEFDDFPIALRDSLRQRSALLAKREKPTTDPAGYYYLQNLSASDPERYMKTNLLEYQPNLSEQDFQHHVDLQSKMIKDGKDSPSVHSSMSFDDTLESVLLGTKTFKDKPSKLFGHELQDYERLRLEVAKRVQALEATFTGSKKGQTATVEEVESEIVKLLAKKYGDRVVSMIAPDEYINFSEADKRDFENRIRGAGKPVTARKLQEMAHAKIRGASVAELQKIAAGD